MMRRYAPIAPRLRFLRSRSDAERLAPARRLARLLRFALILAAGTTAPTVAQAVADERSACVDCYDAYVAEASKRFGVPIAWIRAVMRQESDSNVRAVSGAGARGLMQIMPETWEELRARWSLGHDPFDPRDNILAGTAYLRQLHDRFGAPGFLAAYNAGPARYAAYLSGRPLPAETRAYVAVLAPVVGSEPLTDPAPISAALRSVEALAWRQAPLFVSAALRIAVAVPPQSGGDNRSASETATARTVTAITPRAHGLFAARTSAGGLH
ncbi:hypothetical protein M2281_005456 [Mesorhizobium soli]|uniref:lytic transglycosylase domain-containing protein n=1 Tax=Pseudaminobacter soli (ex Li et al. 2025) TaxID=1295366 RepID=UPI00247673E0|nr:lytic transglycosylase domain-containing protein [Mesorhizobium soli]MDH6234835.1 hypothetical protein [Mesorhizobium soli]